MRYSDRAKDTWIQARSIGASPTKRFRVGVHNALLVYDERYESFKNQLHSQVRSRAQTEERRMSRLFGEFLHAEVRHERD